jgi:hypothetical protein
MFQKTPLRVARLQLRCVLPVAEALVGFCVLFSFQTKRALISGSVLMLVLTFGSTLRQNWLTVGIQLMYSGLFPLLAGGALITTANRVGLPLQRAQDHSASVGYRRLSITYKSILCLQIGHLISDAAFNVPNKRMSRGVLE